MSRIIFILFIPFLSFSQIDSCKDLSFQKMFMKSVSNITTAPNYLVINAVNEITGESKEIYLESMRFYEIIDPDYSGIEDSNINFNENCIATFSFNTKEKLEKIGYYRYQNNIVDSLNKILPANTIGQIKKEYRKGENILIDKYIELYSIYFLHYLYKNKILTFRDCESGYIYIEKIY